MNKVVKNNFKQSKKGQIWIETVVYTLIAFAILGAVLSVVKPRLEKIQDKSIIEQSIKMMEEIDSTIREIDSASGNKRQIELNIKKGSLKIDGEKDIIVFDIESKLTYSEPGEIYKKGEISITNEKIGELNKLNATLDYTGKYDLRWNMKDNMELLTKSSESYNIFVSNDKDENGVDIINFEFG